MGLFGKLEVAENFQRAMPRLRAPEALRDVADLDVLADAQATEQAHGLNGPHDAGMWKAVARQPGTVAVAHNDGAGERPLKTGENVDQGRLSGTVRADQSQDLAAFEPNTDLIDRYKATEPDGHTLRPKGHGRAPGWR